MDLFLVSTLEDRIRRTRSAQTVDAQALVQSANLIAEVNGLAAEADAAFASGSREQARVQDVVRNENELETEFAESEQVIESTAAVIERLETELAENQDERDGLTTELSGS